MVEKRDFLKEYKKEAEIWNLGTKLDLKNEHTKESKKGIWMERH